MSRKILIVGGVAGGASAAARLRRLDEQAEIILFEKGPYISFANCGLPYHVGGVIEDREALLLQTPESFKGRFNVDVRIHNEVIKVNPQEKFVTVRMGDGEYTESFDYLILSPGSTPLKPPITGIDQEHIFTLWTIPDMDKITAYIKEHKPQNILVAGGGFIGLEMVENFVELGLNVSLVEMQNQVMAPLDLDMAQILHNHMKDQGVHLYLEEKVVSFQKDSVQLESGKLIPADMVLMSLGVRPNTDFLKDSGIEMTPRGALRSNLSLQTNYDYIYAIGDAATVIDLPTGNETVIPLAGPANKQGRMAADNIVLGNTEKYLGTMGTGIAKVFDLTSASTGINEKGLAREGKVFGEDYLISQIIVKDHAGYYPGAMPMTIKAIFAKADGKLLGCQIVGYEGVDKRIDVFGTAMKLGATIEDLKNLELAYAPPYSSAKDPMNMVGFVGENLMRGVVQSVHVQQLKDHPDAVILDVRTADELLMGSIGGAINIPLDELRARHGELDKSQKYIVTCAIGLRGYVASRILKQLGFEHVYNLAGGYTHYNEYFCSKETSSCSIDGPLQFSDSGSFEPQVKPLGETRILQVKGLQCPGPIMQVSKAIQDMKAGDVLEVHADDPGFFKDIPVWCTRTQHTLLSNEKSGREIITRIQKSGEHAPVKTSGEMPHDKTIVVFSGDLDKAIASLIIANGAASMGRKVTMFYTFWGLNILRKNQYVPVQKNLIEKAFGMMMPRGTKQLGLSRMNFVGIGAQLIRKIMKDHNVDQVESLLKQALDNGITMIACNMSMDLMGIKEEELIEGVELGGVASYLGAAEEADTNLFI